MGKVSNGTNPNREMRIRQKKDAQIKKIFGQEICTQKITNKPIALKKSKLQKLQVT